MSSYTAPLDDILFCLRDIAKADRLPDWDEALFVDITRAFAAFAENIISPINAPGDLHGCTFKQGRVRMPAGFAAVYQQLAAGGWQGLSAPETFGGMAQSQVVGAAITEIFAGANHSLQMLCGLVPGAIATLERFGTTKQCNEWIPRFASGEALSTMCLTEPGAGSDLSRIATKAQRSGDDWSLSGEKVFISGADHDMSNDIVHLVLARSGARDSGIKGLSLFLCPRSQSGDTIAITRIEDKLGLHASPTCHMVFDKAPAQLVGVEGEGLAAMFTMMNHARIDVSLQGVAHACRANDIARAYAGERVQGRGPDDLPATLDRHVDVRRMLDEQVALSLGARAMCHIALVELELGTRSALVDFLTPVVKVFASNAGIRSADLAIQILGGYGYITEYGVSQIWRDARITAIYEGANGIHERTTATRGLRAQSGAGADAFEALIGELTDHPQVLTLLGDWRAARKNVTEAPDPSALAHDFAELTGTLFYRAVWARIAACAPTVDHTRIRARVLAAPLPVTLPLNAQWP